jgi:hypothetical protein
MIAECCIRMDAAVVEDLEDGLDCVLGSLGLLSSKRIKSYYESNVDDTHIVENAGDVAGGEMGRAFYEESKLCGLAKDGLVPSGGGAPVW